MTRRRMPSGAKTLLFAVGLTLVGLAWVWKQSRYEHISNQMLALERQQVELQNEAGNLRQQLLQLSQYTRVEAQARTKLGMTFPSSPPDTIWTEKTMEQASIGSSIFFAALRSRERPSPSHK